MEGRSEKLAQEGLRGNRDRFAVGKRICSGVREVAHDLEGVHGTGGFLHRQYQTDRWVRIVNTKLTDGSEWFVISQARKKRGGSLFAKDNVKYVTLHFCAEGVNVRTTGAGRREKTL